MISKTSKTQISLGGYIANLRALHKKSLREIEGATGISNAHLHQIEKGVIEKPSVELLEKLATYFQVDPGYLNDLAGRPSDAVTAEDRRPTPYKFITAAQIEQFAGRKEAEGLLPQMIRDLISSTVPHEFLRMPTGDSVALHGWDGRLECTSKPGIQFVPEGESCWEMSRAKKIVSKFKEDLKKRNKDPIGVDPQQTALVHVTFRQMNDRQRVKYLEEMDIAGIWKECRVIDAVDLELWLEQSPGVALHYAKKLELFPAVNGLIPLSDFWDTWWASTTPAIDHNILLEAGKRCDEVNQISGNPNFDHLKVKSNDLDVGLAFLHAAFSKLDDKSLSRSMISRAIIVETLDAFRAICARGRGLILIPKFKGAPVGEAKLNGHQVISLVNTFNPNDLDVVGRVRASLMADFLKVEGGYSDEKADRISRSCYGNISVLKRMLADEGESTQPLWARRDLGNLIFPLVMLGGWNSANEADREIVAAICRRPYADIESDLLSIHEDQDLLFQKSGTSFTFYQEYCFSHLLPLLSGEGLEAFFVSAKAVLCDLNTKYELEPEQRYAASLYKKGSRYSSRIRSGIATTLAILANIGASSWPELQLRINGIVHDILDKNDDWRFWASLGDVLMLLAEASPGEFLNQLEKVCTSKNFVEIFKQTTSMGGCEYASVLWALESCAWDRRHFKQVARTLAAMAPFENKKSNYVNQPSNTLRDIFRVWANQSNLSFAERMTVLREIESEFSDQVWTLVLRLIPRPHESGNYTYRPRFRDIEGDALGKDSGLTYANVLGALTDYILELVQKAPLRWQDVIELIFSIRPRSYQTKLLDALAIADLRELSQETKISLWRELETSLARHTEFSESEWSIKGTNLKKATQIYESLVPKDKIVRWAHVFDGYVSHPLLERVSGDNYERRSASLRRLQIQAVNEILECKIENGLETLLTQVPNAWVLGSVLAEISPQFDQQVVQLANLSDKGVSLLEGFVGHRYSTGGDAWLDEFLSKSFLSNEGMRAKTYLAIGNAPAVWRRLEKESDQVRRTFWESIRRVFVPEDVSAAVYAAERLLESERPFVAFDLLANLEGRKSVEKVPTELFMRTLESLMNADPGVGIEKADLTLFDYHLENVLKNLGSRDDADKRKLAMIEWNFLPIFKYRKVPENLTDQVGSDPDLFIDILKMAYKKDDLTNEVPKNAAAAERAYQFLHDNKFLPGMSRSKDFDVEQFHKWYAAALEKARDCQRTRAFESVMGGLLAYSPFDPEDNAWPHRGVRDVVERYGSEDLESGLYIGLINKRGVYTKSLGEGGVQERQLANEYTRHAEACQMSWSRTANVLRKLASRYMADAHQEDVRSLRE